MNKPYFLGIDTSNYKTSVSVVDSDGAVIFNRSELLSVEKGDRGLRQSEAFFLHCNRLPEYCEDLFARISMNDIAAIGVSARPRNVEGSYMPCFLAGFNLAREIAAAASIPLYKFSHQDGHAAAVLESGLYRPADSSILFHLSGGTTEFLKCVKTDSGYDMEIIGGTLDISFGQLLDRTGVALGYPFPAGAYLDRIALESLGKYAESKSVLSAVMLKDGYFNLSGIETQALRIIESGAAEKDKLISDVFTLISKLICDAAIYLTSKYKIGEVYLAGGVSASETVKNRIKELIPFNNTEIDDNLLSVRIANSMLSGDNAIGTALLAKRNYESTPH